MFKVSDVLAENPLAVTIGTWEQIEFSGEISFELMIDRTNVLIRT